MGWSKEHAEDRVDGSKKNSKYFASTARSCCRCVESNFYSMRGSGPPSLTAPKCAQKPAGCLSNQTFKATEESLGEEGARNST